MASIHFHYRCPALRWDLAIGIAHLLASCLLLSPICHCCSLLLATQARGAAFRDQIENVNFLKGEKERWKGIAGLYSEAGPGRQVRIRSIWSNEQKKFREYKLQTVEGWRTKVVSEAMGQEALMSGNICHHWLHSRQCDVFSSLYMYISYIFCLYPLPSDVDTNISFKLDGNWSASKPWHPQVFSAALSVFSAGPTEKTSFTLRRFREGLG